MNKHIHIRDFQEDLHAVLTDRARQRGLSLSAYLRLELADLARRPASAGVFDRLRALPTISASVSGVDLVRADRDGR